MDTSKFIEKAKLIHGDRYDYSLVDYKGYKYKIKIICPIHGEFEQLVGNHLKGANCLACANIIIKNKNLKDKEYFVTKSNLIHNSKYDYSKTSYSNIKTNVIIICPIHGEFKQKPKDHLSGCGCSECGYITRIEKKTTNVNKFINQANLIHNNKYDYKNLIYKSAHDKIKIICPIHGEFEQTAHSHLNGSGCPKCFNELRKLNSPSWNKTSWLTAASKAKNFDSFKLYVIKCYNETETFYKIGRTYNTLKTRFKQLPYQYEIIKTIISEDGGYIYDLENRFKRINKHKRYTPKIKFGGMYECFF